LLGAAAVVIALTGVDPVMLRTTRALVTLFPRYDPFVEILVGAPVVIAVLVLGSIALKTAARRGSLRREVLDTCDRWKAAMIEKGWQ